MEGEIGQEGEIGMEGETWMPRRFPSPVMRGKMSQFFQFIEAAIFFSLQ